MKSNAEIQYDAAVPLLGRSPKDSIPHGIAMLLYLLSSARFQYLRKTTSLDVYQPVNGERNIVSIHNGTLFSHKEI